MNKMHTQRILTSTSMARILQYMGFKEEASKWALHVQECTKEPSFNCCCIATVCNSIEKVSNVWFEQAKYVGVSQCIKVLQDMSQTFKLPSLCIEAILAKLEVNSKDAQE